MTQTLFSKFVHALNWNAFLYVFYRIASMILSVWFYKLFSEQDYNIWANLHALIFLALLWFDIGFRKSIPRFAPLFSQSRRSFKRFNTAVTHCFLTLLFLVSPVFFYSTSQFFEVLNIAVSPMIIGIATLLFVTEGLVSLSRLTFHSHFWNKQFNIMLSITLSIEILLNFIMILLYKTKHLLILVMLNKLIVSIFIIFGSYFLFAKLKRTIRFEVDHAIDTQETWKSFVKHSAVMWFTNTTKSLTERNFLVPIFTYFLGPATANFFKIANDGALLFERTIVKTIGTADTALLSHVEVSNNDTQAAFNLIIRKVSLLCSIMIGIFTFIWLHGPIPFLHIHFHTISVEPKVFQLFCILTISHLIETLFSPYERLLEVKQRYSLLLTIYVPFLIFIVTFFATIPLIGIVGFVIGIQSFRLVGLLWLALLARNHYSVRFPIFFTIKAFAISILSAIFLHFLLFLQ